MDNRHKRRIAGALMVVALVGAGIAMTRGRFGDTVNALGVDLRHPDVLVRSTRLGDLPKDLVRAPLLSGVLTEDFVHYYEDHPTRLSLLGTLKRLAYDHQLTLADRLIATVLDAPGELALWRDGKGRPEHFVLMLEHNLATQAALQLARVGLPDKQLSVAGEVGSPLGGKTTVYALKLNSHVTWLVASRGRRTVVLSDPGLLLEAGGDGAGKLARPAAAVLLEALDTAPGGRSPFAADFGLDAPGAVAGTDALRQQIAAKAGFLSFGYQHFFPGVEALRLDLSAGGRWQLAARATGPALTGWGQGAAALWAGLPRSSALCAALPLDPQRLQAVVGNWGVEAGAAELLPDLEPVGAVCWGQPGGVFAPLLALRLRPAAETLHDAALPKILAAATARPPRPAAQADTETPDPMAPDEVDSPAPASDSASEVASQAAMRAAGGTTTNPAADPSSGADAPSAEPSTDDVRTTALKKPAGGTLWTRSVAHEFGAVKQGGVRRDTVAVARVGTLLLASTDVRMVRQALSVAAKTYPALNDLPTAGGALPVLSVDAAQLSRLLEQQTWRTLRPSQTPTFYRAAHQLLPARLQALAKIGRVSVGLPAQAVAGQGGGSDPHWVTLATQQQPAAGARP